MIHHFHSQKRNLNFAKKCLKSSRIVARLKRAAIDFRSNPMTKTIVRRDRIMSVCGMSRFHADRKNSYQVNQIEVVCILNGTNLLIIVTKNFQLSLHVITLCPKPSHPLD